MNVMGSAVLGRKVAVANVAEVLAEDRVLV
jgi:hypothetical protein